MTTYLCPSRPGHQALRNNFASSLLLRAWLPYDWTPRSEACFASPLALCARRVSSAASRLLGAYQPSLRSPWLAAWEMRAQLKSAGQRYTLVSDAWKQWLSQGRSSLQKRTGCSKPCGVPARSAPRIICCRYNRHWTHRSPASNCTATSGTPGWHG
ncbi:hypothetical protein [Thiolapillus sp.]|uniref:hypothetical protein n=1 Tax=Thiolapillus sp. TaxID=2017437 RepID=UPI003AF94FF3